MKGTRLADRYAIEERVATGGMGTVFVAVDERLGRRVAIKVLKEELAHDPRFVERFRREARAAGALSHPNVAGVYDFGEDSDRHFMVMEMASGRDLAQVLREEGRLSSDRVVRIGTQIAEAIGHAHNAGLVHRDIKPANVIIGEEDKVKVTDFGIARAAGDSTLTATGSVLGTAHYISPEQAAGDKIGPGTDIYSLGIVLYEMITGTLPFTGDSALAVAMRHVSDEVPRPGELNRDVPDGLDDVVAKATAKAPEDRYASGSDLAAALAASLSPTADQPAVTAAAAAGAVAGSTAVLTGAGTGIEAQEARVWPIPGQRWDPRRIGRAVIAIFAFLLLLAAGLLLWRLTSNEAGPRGQAPQAEEPAGGPADQPQEPTTTTAAGVTIPGTIVGMHKDEATELLVAQGLRVDETDTDSEDFEEDVVVTTNPEPGTVVPPGEVVTLFVSTGEEPDEDGDSSGPGNSEGKGKDKDKGDEGGD
ncbi:MAG: Stk1 family PASTA domain-containing Ser/Thr kinase [Actinomycetota bacterium]